MTGLKKNTDFQNVYRRGVSRADRYLVIYRWSRPEGGESRIGISVSKRVGNSVVRHRIKRRVKEICRLSESDIPDGCDFVVIARNPSAEAGYADLEHSYSNLMRRLNS